MSEITAAHRGIEIIYRESDSTWMCDLFTQPAATLTLARPANIDLVKLIHAHEAEIKRVTNLIYEAEQKMESWKPEKAS